LQGKQPEHGVGRSPTGDVAQVVGDRVDADEQLSRVQLRDPADERSVAGAEVDVDRAERARAIEQSSTVDPALLPAFDEDHGLRIARARPARQRQAVVEQVRGQLRSGGSYRHHAALQHQLDWTRWRAGLPL